MLPRDTRERSLLENLDDSKSDPEGSSMKNSSFIGGCPLFVAIKISIPLFVSVCLLGAAAVACFLNLD